MVLMKYSGECVAEPIVEPIVEPITKRPPELLAKELPKHATELLTDHFP
jgi:hypothetical protein